MALPRKLKHLNLFNDGNNWQGIVESLTLPKFTRKFEKYRGGGMPGAVDVDMGLDDGALRGTRLQAIMDMDVGAMMTVIPRISTPTLTAQEMAELDPADLTALSVEVVTFLLKKSVLAGLPTA